MMDDYTADDVREALRPLASLASKSAKAQQKLAPGTWQATMLADNLRALEIASALMTEEPLPEPDFTAAELQAALDAFASMVARTEKAFGKFTPGTSQHSLQRNRLEALRVAGAVIQAKLDEDV